MSDVDHAYTLVARALYDGQDPEPRQNMAVDIAGDRITLVRPASDQDADARVVDILCPGFVDLQINGANDVQFNDTPTARGVAAIVEGARNGGTTHILPTFITAPDDSYVAAIDAVTQARRAGCAGILGVHLEGPFLSPDRPGIHPAHCIREIGETDVRTLQEADCGIRLVTLAPECAPQGVIRQLTESGVIVFAGHSAATVAELSAAARDGLRGATHLFNAMSQITGREPGVVGGVLTSDALYAGIIADGVHVHPDNLTLAHRMLGDRLCLVTDAMLTLAGRTTEFSIYGVPIHRDGNRLANAEGRLAGAHLAMDEAVRNMIQFCGIPVGQALYMAGVAPVHALGLERERGRIAAGFSASMTLLSKDCHAVGAVVDGQMFAP